jgi:glycosyltransferase involved in cell wall biosynthesis
MNEAKNLPHVLPRIPEDVFEVLLVDGGSSDETIETALELLPDLRVLHQPGRGKGDALICGFKSARGDIVVMLDADGSARPEEIPTFVDVLVAGADFAKGSRFLQNGGSADITRLRALGNKALTGLVNLFLRSRYSDLCYG